jgi:hypothetical protein
MVCRTTVARDGTRVTVVGQTTALAALTAWIAARQRVLEVDAAYQGNEERPDERDVRTTH